MGKGKMGQKHSQLSSPACREGTRGGWEGGSAIHNNGGSSGSDGGGGGGPAILPPAKTLHDDAANTVTFGASPWTIITGGQDKTVAVYV